MSGRPPSINVTVSFRNPGMPSTRAEKRYNAKKGKSKELRRRQQRIPSGPRPEGNEAIPAGPPRRNFLQTLWARARLGRQRDEEIRNNLRQIRFRYRLRSLIILVIALLLVFGVLYSVLEYLLLSIRAAATCIPSTVFVPVTVTVTATPISPTTTAVVTSLVPVTDTVTIFAPDPIISAQSFSSLPTYYFYVTSGSTIWQDGISPAGGQSLTYATTSYTVVPTPAAVNMVTSVFTEFETFTPPAYTSTFYSLQMPDATTTLTSTHYVTVSVSEVVQPTRSSFTGIASDGWNASTESLALTPSFDPAVSTSTQTYFTPVVSSSVESTTTIHLTSTSMTTVYSTITPVGSSTEPLTTVNVMSIVHSTRCTTITPLSLSTVSGNFSVSGTNITVVSLQTPTDSTTTVHKTSTILTTLYTTITASSLASSNISAASSNATTGGNFSTISVNATHSSNFSAISVNATQSSKISAAGINITSSSIGSEIKPTTPVHMSSTNGTMLRSTITVSPSMSSNSSVASINATTSRDISATHTSIVKSSNISATQDSATTSSKIVTTYVNATMGQNMSTPHTSVTMSSSIVATRINATTSRNESTNGIHTSL